MNLRSQLAISHLKVLLVFVVIHLLLFVIAVTLSSRDRNLTAAQLQDLETQSKMVTELPQLIELVENFALENDLIAELESTQGGPRSLGNTRPRPRGPRRPPQVLWQGENGTLAAFHFRKPGGPPTNPITHVLLTTLLAGVFGVYLAFRSSKTISTPLADLLEATEQLEAGNEDKIALAHNEGPQEVQTLAKSFSRMSETLSANLKQLKEERDKAEASEKSRRQLIADVSHNLRTPLAAAVGWLDSLIDGHVEEQEPCFRQIRRETLWASQRLERMLRLSRWEHTEPMMTMRSLGLSDIVLEVAENLEDRAKEVGLSLELEIEPGLKVRGDRHHLRDLIQILLENVIEHAGEDRKALLQAKVLEEKVEFVVSDNGPGLSTEFLGRWTGDPVVAKTGRVSLGLAIARRLAKVHGSELTLCNRQDGTGVTARFTMTRG